MDSLWHVRLYELFGVENPMKDNHKLTVCEWKLKVKEHIYTDYPCSPRNNPVTVGPLLTEDLRWSQSDILFGCDHDQYAGSIALSILKILCLSEYRGTVLDDYFDGESYRSSLLLLHSTGQQLYEYIESAAPNYTERGIEILSPCGFNIIT